MAGSSHMLFSSPTDTPASTTRPTKTDPTIPRPRGRKSGSSKQANKQPQRGMGVAQLERIIRVQTDNNNNNNNNNNPAVPSPLMATAATTVQVQYPYQLYHDPAAGVGFGVPVHLPKFGGFGPVIGPGLEDGAAGRVWPGVVVATAAGRVEGLRSSLELPSIPKMELAHQGFDHNHEIFPGFASKKKRVLNGNEEICRENCSEKVEVVAVHRKSNAAGRVGLLMEYGFFPNTKGNSDSVVPLSSSSTNSSSSAHCFPPYPATTLNIGGADIGGSGGGVAGFSLFRSDGEGSIDLSLRL